MLAHASRDRLLAADVHIDYQTAIPNYDPAASAVTFKSIAIDKGDLERGFAQADHVIEGEYRVGSQEQLYIEPNGVIAVPAEDGLGITVYGYYMKTATQFFVLFLLVGTVMGGAQALARSLS
jgi:xanthine dehydrogenase molybdopterin-binding subunit B